MKRFLSFALVSLSMILLSCRTEEVAAIEYKVSADMLEFSVDGGTQEFFVQTMAEVKAESSLDWCVVTREAYSSDKLKKFKVTALANTSTSVRDAVITLTIGADNTETIMVRQKANPLILSAESLQLTSDAQQFEVGVETSSDYEVTTDAYWIEIVSKEEARVVFSAQKNIATSHRSAEIVFTTSGCQIVFKVAQSGSAAEAPAPDKTGMESDAKTLAKKMNLGINLGNTLEAIGGEMAWGAPKTTEEIIKYFKQSGFNAVRIPCSWHQHLVDKENYIVSDRWMNRVKEVVDYVVDNDMYAILNIHWDQGWLENDIPNGYSEAVNAEQHAIWTQIATTFRDYDEHLLFAGTNEPNVENASHMETLLRYEQTFVDAVRATGGRNAYRVLVFQGPSTDIDKTVNLMTNLPEDTVEDRLIAEVHYYTPWQFCGMNKDESWGKMMYFWGDDQKGYATGSYAGKWLSGYNESFVASQMQKMKTKFWDKGIPVIIGEFSVCTTKDCNIGTDAENKKAYEGYMKSRAAFNGCVVREAKANGCVPFYWHCEGDLIDRTELRITEQATYDAMIEASGTQYPD